MKNNNLKKAFLEVAEKELEHLPKEEDIFHTYSDTFEKKMKRLFKDEKKKEMNEINKKYFSLKKTAFAVVAIIMCLSITAVAGEIIQMLSAPELIPKLQEAVKNAETGEGVEDFDEAFSKSEDPFAIATADGENGQILLDYSESMDFDISVENKGYVFTLRSVTKALEKDLKVISGSVINETAVCEYQVNDAYYAILEVSREDGKKLDLENDKVWVEWGFMIEGFEPMSTNMCLRGYSSYCYEDGYKVYYAVEITNMMYFAGRDFALVALEGGYGYTIDRNTVYADKDGAMELKNDDFIGALLRFRVDDKYYDEKAAEEFMGDTCFNSENWFWGYTK